MKVSKDIVSAIAAKYKMSYADLQAFVNVEGGQYGFDPSTGKIIIQFEPTWFHTYLVQFKVPHLFVVNTTPAGKRIYKISASGRTIENGVEGQVSEWKAFNTAFSINPKAAMLATSIGAMQVMGFNYAKLGFKSVDEMWDFFKLGEAQQVEGGARYIANNNRLYKAVITQDFDTQGLLYNGENYKENDYANKLRREHKKYE